MRFHRENKTPCLDGENTVFHRVFASPRIHGSLKNFAIFGRASTRNSKLLNDLAGIFACFAGVKDRVVLAMQLPLSIAVLQRAVRKDGAEKPERTGKHRPLWSRLGYARIAPSQSWLRNDHGDHSFIVAA
jgi:hypothetical protein